MPQRNEIVDKTKLTQRELLIRLSDQMESFQEDMKDVKREVPAIKDRLTKVETQMETRIVVIAGAVGIVSIIFTLIVNIFGLFN
jgi:hypothetical protein